jgi:hypothetical protein
MNPRQGATSNGSILYDIHMNILSQNSAIATNHAFSLNVFGRAWIAA